MLYNLQYSVFGTLGFKTLNTDKCYMFCLVYTGYSPACLLFYNIFPNWHIYGYIYEVQYICTYFAVKQRDIDSIAQYPVIKYPWACLGQMNICRENNSLILILLLLCFHIHYWDLWDVKTVTTEHEGKRGCVCFFWW